MLENFYYIGTNFKKAALEIRDHITFTDSQKMDFLQQAEAIGIEQMLVLSTCNRCEIFFFVTEQGQYKQVEQLYQAMFPRVCWKEIMDHLEGEAAVAYFFRITAGLESMVLGEDQILGQVKEAAELSQTLGYSKKELNYVVRQAVTCAKKIKTELKISEKPLSVGYIGIQTLNERCSIKGKKALVIGSGNTAVLAIRYLYEYGISEVVVCNRTHAHAQNVAQVFPDIIVIPYEKRYEEISHCDIVISATASPHCVIKKEKYTADNPVVFLDLASPRDIDAALSELDSVEVINLDVLQKISQKNQSERLRLVEISKTWIDAAVVETKDWMVSSRMDSTIASLKQKCDEIVEDSFSYLNRKMELGSREQKLLRKVLASNLKRLLKEPILELKQIDSVDEQETYRKVVHDLFHIKEEDF